MDLRNQMTAAVFTAPPGERLASTASPPARIVWRRAVATLAACLLIHMFLLAPLFFEFRYQPQPVPEVEETPIEVVQEPPPPAQQPQNNAAKEPPPPPASLSETFANDAPRAQNNEKNDRKAPDEVSKSPVQQPPAEAARPAREALNDAPQPRGRETLAAEKPMSKPLDVRPDAEIVKPLAAPAEQDVAAGQSGQAETPPEKPVGPLSRQVGTMAFLQDYKSATAAPMAPIATGQAQVNFFSIIFGMVQVHFPGLYGPRTGGEISFTIDGAGKILSPRLVHRSSVPGRDEAAMNAIRQSAPYPPSPLGGPINVSLEY